MSWEFEVYHRAVSVEAAKLRQVLEVKFHNSKNARRYRSVLDVGCYLDRQRLFEYAPEKSPTTELWTKDQDNTDE
jgi:hypothetical protein